MNTKWNRRSTIAFAAATLLTGAGVVVVASSSASPGSSAGTTSISRSHSHAVEDAGAHRSDHKAADNPAVHDVGDDKGVDAVTARCRRGQRLRWARRR